jgi:cell division protein FtsL
MKAIGVMATLLLLVAVLASALGVVWTRHEAACCSSASRRCRTSATS